MPAESSEVVVNTGPLIALAARGHLDLEVMGTVGLLLRGKRKGIWLSNRLVEFILREANES
jgi:predicted nucleic acid-binding protein